jgi:hypothetical protein
MGETMSDETPDDDQRGRGFSFELPLPGDLVRAVVEHRDRAEMTATDKRVRVEAFLDGLDVDQLLALRFILNCCGGEEGAFAMNQYFDGMVYTLLRRVHGVNPDTGRDAAADLLEQEAARQQPPEA